MVKSIANAADTVISEVDMATSCNGGDGTAERLDLISVLNEARKALAPLWPLRDFVAVNPFIGMASCDFLTAHRRLRRLADADILMPLGYFQTLFHQGEFTTSDIARALDDCRAADPEPYRDIQVNDIVANLRIIRSDSDDPDNYTATVAGEIDRWNATDWSRIVVDEISRFCAAQFDEGQATWANPWQGLPLYHAWREAASIDRRLELLGASGFRAFVANLPPEPLEAIGRLLDMLAVPVEAINDFLLCQLYTVIGWASYLVQKQGTDPAIEIANDEVIGLLAIRLAYDAGLAASGLMPAESIFAERWRESVCGGDHPSDDALIRYAMQTACEIAYRRKLLASLRISGTAAPPNDRKRKAVQMVFCIDVRSEIVRRQLETVSEEIETFGFAGFFGLPIEYVPLGCSKGSAQCPVLLKPSIRVQETVRDGNSEVGASVEKRRSNRRVGRKVWKSFQRSAASCFSFVETLGLSYLGNLVVDSLGFTSPSDGGRFDGVVAADREKLGPSLTFGDGGEVSASWAASAEGILRNLGLTENFARLIVFCGHGSEMVNNPYKAGFDCGACGGHTGESNARTAAALLNDPAVRSTLQQCGIEIPNDTVFLAALHNTTTDEIRFFDVDLLPRSHWDELFDLRAWTRSAADQARRERAGRLNVAEAADLKRRSRNWSEVRPEWGLAGNAAFIVAPRSRTRGIALNGRTFLHSYDYRRDRDYRVLELIMTAPMVVTNWINLQYYASTVNNEAFGSGNKVLHNVVGQLGVLEGNAGDLRTGLPWQSVHDGTNFQHEPLRLLVMIEAPRAAIQTILDKHDAVRDLAANRWLQLAAIEGNRVFCLSSDGSWREQDKSDTGASQ